MIAELFSIIAPVFICAAIGIILARWGRPYDPEMLSSLVLTIGTPCLVFNTLSNITLDLGTVGKMVLMGVIIMAIAALIGIALLKAMGRSIRAFLPALIIPNNGNLGLPVVLFAFGEEGLALGIAYFVVSIVGQHTVGLSIASGAIAFRTIFRSPVFYAVALAVVFMVTGLKQPEWLDNTTRLLGGMTIPLMLVTLGYSLARLEVRGLKKCLVLALLRLALGFAIALGLSEALGLEGVFRGVLILQSAMPVAVFSYIYAQRFHTEPEEVAGMVVISSAVAFLSLPALLWYLL